MKTAERPDRLAVSQEEAAKLLNVSTRTLHRWTVAGKVRSGKPCPGGRRLYAMDELRRVAAGK